MFLELPKLIGKSLVKPGDNVLLTCKHTGSHAITWYKDNKKIKSKRKSKGQLMNNTLLLTNITSDSSGTYGCSVVIDKRSFTSTIKVDVFGKYASLCNRKSNFYSRNAIILQLYILLHVQNQHVVRVLSTLLYFLELSYSVYTGLALITLLYLNIGLPYITFAFYLIFALTACCRICL